MSIYRGNFTFDRFTIIPNSWARDPRLDISDKGLLTYILSHSPGYPLTIEQVIAENRNGYDSINSAMKRLEKVGYLRRDRQRGPDGRLGPYDWYLIEPHPSAGRDQLPDSRTGPDQEGCGVSAGRDQSGISTPGFTRLANPGTKKTISKKLTLEDQEDSPLPPAASNDQPRTTRCRDDGGRDAPQKENQEHAEAVGLVDRFIGDIPTGSITTVGRTRLVGATGAALDRGCTRLQIIEAINEQLPTGDVKSLAGLLAARITKLEAPRKPTPKPPKCDGCDENRWIEVRTGDHVAFAKCPRCHPGKVWVTA